jgi:hypothetical protein
MSKSKGKQTEAADETEWIKYGEGMHSTKESTFVEAQRKTYKGWVPVMRDLVKSVDNGYAAIVI